MTRQQAIAFLNSQITKFAAQIEQGLYIAHNEMCIRYARKHIAAMEGEVTPTQYKAAIKG